jgi:hypothetical protein
LLGILFGGLLPARTSIVTTTPIGLNYANPSSYPDPYIYSGPVFSPGFTSDAVGSPTYVHVLEHAYDPTNGTRSEGDIFMRVRKP